MSDFYKGDYPAKNRITMTLNESTLNLSGKTATVDLESPSGIVRSFTTSDSELSVYDESNGIIDFGSVDADLWNEVGVFVIHPLADNLHADKVYQMVLGVAE